MSNTFKVGDLVQLKSGGPRMTVQKRFSDDDDSWVCAWFVGAAADKLCAEVFPSATLKSVET